MPRLAALPEDAKGLDDDDDLEEETQERQITGELIRAHLPMVRRLALALARRLPPSIELDDLIQEGSLGLMQAAARYDPRANDSFALYAQPRILGSMRDSIRRRHWQAAILLPLEEGLIREPVQPIHRTQKERRNYAISLRAA